MTYFHLILLGESWRPGEAQLISECSSELCRISLEKPGAAESHAHSQNNQAWLRAREGQDLEDGKAFKQDTVLKAFLNPSLPGPESKEKGGSDLLDLELSFQGCDEIIHRSLPSLWPPELSRQHLECIIRNADSQGYLFLSPFYSALKKSLAF